MEFQPSLGSTTTLLLLSSEQEPIRFTATLPTSDTRTPEIWTTLLPFGGGESEPTAVNKEEEREWRAVPFERVQAPAATAGGHAAGGETAFYSARLRAPGGRAGTYEFTYRLRRRSFDGSVDWLGNGGGNGRITLLSSSSPAAPGGGKGEIWKGTVESAGEEKEGWQQSFEVGPGLEGEVKEWEMSLPDAPKEGGWAVFQRNKPTWIEPIVISSLRQLPSHLDTVLLFSLSSPHLILLPISDNETSTSLRGSVNEPGKVIARSTREREQGGKAKVVVIATKEHEGVEEGLKRAIQFAGTAFSSSASNVTINSDLNISSNSSSSNNVKGLFGALTRSPLLSAPTKINEHGKSLGWCTWNALGPEYSLSQVLEALDALQPSVSSSLGEGEGAGAGAGAGEGEGSSLRPEFDTVLLDDGWQDVLLFKDEQGRERKRLTSFAPKKGWVDIIMDVPSGGGNGSGSGREGRTHRRRQDSGFEDMTKSPVKKMPSSSRELSEEDDEEEEDWERRKEEMRGAVEAIKKKGIKRVGVWMTLNGYWDGLDPSSSSFSDQFGPLVEYQLSSTSYPLSSTPSSSTVSWFLPPPSQIENYYHSYFSYLRSVGVDFVKVDNQAQGDFLLPGEGVGRTRREMLDGMLGASKSVWGKEDEEAVVHCMAHSPRVFCGPLAFNTVCKLHKNNNNNNKAVMRNSDDFFPLEPDSHRYHIRNNLFLALYSRNLAFELDADMFMSSHSHGAYHALLRAGTSAKVWLTDEPGKQPDGQVLSRLLARNKDGEVKVVQLKEGALALLPSRLGKVEQAMREGNGSALLGSVGGVGGGAMLVVWNARKEGAKAVDVITVGEVKEALQLKEAKGSFVLAQVAAAAAGQPEWAAVVDFAKKDKDDTSAPVCTVELNERESASFVVAPVFELPRGVGAGGGRSTSTTPIACLGLVDKYAALAGIISVKIVAPSSSSSSSVKKQQHGRKLSEALGAAIPSLPVINFSSTSTVQPPTPPATSHAAFLLSRVLRSSAFFSVNSSSSATDTRTVRSELTGLVRSFFASPVKTIWTETRAVVAFGLLFAFWTLQSFARQLRGGQAGGRRQRAVEQKEEGRSLPDRDEEEGKEPLLQQEQDQEGETWKKAEEHSSLLEVKVAFEGKLAFAFPFLSAEELAEKLAIKEDGVTVPTGAIRISSGGEGGGSVASFELGGIRTGGKKGEDVWTVLVSV